MGNKRLTILQINDTHGYLEEHQEMFWDAGGKRHAIKSAATPKSAVISNKSETNAARLSPSGSFSFEKNNQNDTGK